MLEIYNESVYDLLAATGEDLDLQLKPKSEEVHVKGLSWEEVATGDIPYADVHSKVTPDLFGLSVLACGRACGS